MEHTSATRSNKELALSSSKWARTARNSNIGTFPICAQTAFVLTNKSAYEELPELKASEQVLNAYWKRLPAEGLEPTRSCDHWILSPARLPVPPRRRLTLKGCFTYEKPSFFASFILARKILKWKNFQRHCFANLITARTNGKPSKTAAWSV